MFIVNTEKIREFLLKYIFEDTKSLETAKLKLKYCLTLGISCAILVTLINTVPNISRDNKKELTEFVQEEDSNKLTDKDTAKVEAVKAYINFALDKKGYSMDDLRLTPSELVLQAKIHNYDLPLLLAQAHLESCFGMTPRARKTNSVFSIGSYDNGKNKAVYAKQDDSIADYINIMKNNYMGGKDADYLLNKSSFVNGAGHRYASDQNYEAKVRSVRNRIIKMYPELLQN